MTAQAIELLAKVTLILTLAWAVTAVLRKSSSAIRHSVWAAAVFACLALPALKWTLPERRVRSVTVRPQWIEAQPAVLAGSIRTWDEMPVGNPARPLPDPKRPPSPVQRSIPMSVWIAGVWIVGAAAALLRLIAGWWHVRRIPVKPLTLSVPVAARVVRAVDPKVMPLTWGFFRPRILFPAGVEEWPEERLQHVLAHELAHIGRRDWAVQLAAETLRALFWFHPLAWVAVRQIRQEAERACDDRVLGLGMSASGYAADVVLLARTLQSPPGGVSSAVAAAHPSGFERRVTAMLNPSMNRRPVTRVALAMNLLLTVAVLAPLAVLAAGQEIRGKVVDPATGQGIPEAEIQIMLEQKVAPGVTSMKTSGRLKTDTQGEFVYKTTDLGGYYVTASKEGYGAIPRPGVLPNMFSSSVFNLDKDHPAQDVRFSLGRRGTLTARFIDGDSQRPIEGLMFRTFAVGARNGAFESAWSGTPVTDGEGEIHLEVVPGNYMLELLPHFWQIKETGKGTVAANADLRILREFQAEDADQTDLDYRLRFFPGGPDLATVLPIPVASGGVANMGTFRLKKEVFYRARVKIGGDCTAGELLTLAERMVSQPTSASSERQAEFGKVACGSEVLIRGLQPGRYSFEASIGEVPNMRRGVVSVTVGESNISFDIAVKIPIALTGRFVTSKDAGEIDYSKIGVNLMANLGGPRQLQDMMPAKLDRNGVFRLENTVASQRRVGVNGLGSSHYVKEIRYRGQAIPGTLFDFTGDGELEIEIDSQPAAVTGTVRDSGNAVARADVVVARWPLIAGDPGMIRHVTADGSGYFQAAGMAPGEYRIFAVTAENQGAAADPVAWQRLLGAAEKLVLTRGSTQSVTLRPVDPAR